MKRKKFLKSIPIAITVLLLLCLGGAACDQKKSIGYVAPTFDDGPDSKTTPKILKALQKYGARATFFVIGEKAKKHPDILRDIIAGGHQLGNHSWSHRRLPLLSEDAADEDLQRTQTTILDLVKVRMTVFRAPFSHINERVSNIARKRKLHVVGWDLDSRDWTKLPPPSGEIAKRVCKDIRSGLIIIMHDDRPNMAEALDQMLAQLERMGLKCVTIDELEMYKKAKLQRR